MPEIAETYQFGQVSSDNLYQYGLEVLKELGAEELREMQAKEVSGMVPSIWVWEGIKLSFKVYQLDGTTKIDLKGYIPQLGTTPLTKTMDKFLSLLAGKLQTHEKYNFKFELLTRFLPKFKLKFTSHDKSLFIIIPIVTFITTLAGSSIGHTTKFFISSIVLGLGFYFGRKILTKK